jgi:hypothetical protein
MRREPAVLSPVSRFPFHSRRLLLAVCATATFALIAAACGGKGKGGGGTLVVNKIAPADGAASGGETILVLGSNLGAPASVSFGNVTGTAVTVLSGTALQVTIPAHAIGVVDLTIHSRGRTVVKPQGFEFLATAEIEPPNGKGDNDAFSQYQRIPLDFDFKGYIGQQDDADVYHVHTPFDGQIFVSLTYGSSMVAGGLAGVSVEFFHGPDPTPNPDAYFGGSMISVLSSAGLQNYSRMSYVQDGHGPFLRVKGIGDQTHAGFDPVHPYTLHVHFVKTDSIEPQPAADSFFQAVTIDPFTASLDLPVNSNYGDDFDWYRFYTPSAGWARVVLSAAGLDTNSAGNEVQVSAKLFYEDPNDPTDLFAVAGDDMLAGDAPGTDVNVFEAGSLLTGGTYYLRLISENYPGGPAFPWQYHVSIEGGAGDFEAQQPGGDLPAEVEGSANVITVAAAGSHLSTDYVFHEADKDWFKVQAPNTQLTITWTTTAIRTALGDYDGVTNPLGSQFALMVFNQTWFDDPAHTTSPVEAVTNGTDLATAANVHTVTIATTAGTNYYIFCDGIRGFDKTDAYTLNVQSN